MQIGEYSFPHLYQAEEEQFTRELEWRRIAEERATESGASTEGTSARRASRRASTLRRLLSHPGGTM